MKVLLLEAQPAIESTVARTLHTAGHLEARYAAAVRIALGADVMSVEASRGPRGVTVSVLAPTDIDGRQRTMLADRARQAIRAFDSFVAVIDISVATADTSAAVVAPYERDRDGADEWFVDDGSELWTG